MTTQLETILTNLTVNSPDWETLKLINAARRIYMGDTPLGLAEYVEVTRRFTEVYSSIGDKEEVKAIRKDLTEYQEKLEKLRITDELIRTDFSLSNALWTIIDRLLYIIVLLPLSLPGWVLNVPLMVIGKAFNNLTPFQETKATHTILSLLFVFPLVYLGFGFLLRYFFGTALSTSMILLPAIGVIHIRLMEEGLTGLQHIGYAVRLMYLIVTNSRTNELNRLRKDRSDLEKRITQIVEQYAKPDYKVLEKPADTENISITKKLSQL